MSTTNHFVPKYHDLHQKFKIRAKKRKFPDDQTLFVATTRVIQFKVESEPFLTERPSTVFYPTTALFRVSTQTRIKQYWFQFAMH